jgi:hypothetical protein
LGNQSNIEKLKQTQIYGAGEKQSQSCTSIIPHVSASDQPQHASKTIGGGRPARIFVCVPEWTGPFDIEIDCVALA